MCWQPVRRATFIDLVIIGETPGAQADIVMYLGLADGVFRSVDAGKSWTPVNNAKHLVGKKIQAITVIENNLFVGTDNGLYRRQFGRLGRSTGRRGFPRISEQLASAEYRLYAVVDSRVKNQKILGIMSISTANNRRPLSLTLLLSLNGFREFVARIRRFYGDRSFGQCGISHFRPFRGN